MMGCCCCCLYGRGAQLQFTEEGGGQGWGVSQRKRLPGCVVAVCQFGGVCVLSVLFCWFRRQQAAFVIGLPHSCEATTLHC
jgi:hypothetical protein